MLPCSPPPEAGENIGEDPAWTGDPALNVPATRAEAAVAFHTYLRKQDAAKGKILVAYFSASGNTEAVANTIADSLNADLFELIPERPYTDNDLNWTNPSSRVNAEHNDPSKQDVKLAKNTVANWADYDTIFIGYPIWWGNAAWPVNDFVKNNDFTGKTVILQIECHPFAQRQETRALAQRYGLQVECWYPLGHADDRLLNNDVLSKIAQAHNKSVVQIILRWHIQEGFSVIPGSTNPAHIEPNLSLPMYLVQSRGSGFGSHVLFPVPDPTALWGNAEVLAVQGHR